MLILAVDSSTQSGSLAVLRDTRVLGEVSTWTNEPYSTRMFRHLEYLQRELALDLKQIDLFAVSAGPGSFTGLRVGLTAVKGWAEVYDKPIAAVSGLEAIAANSHSTTRLLAPFLDARREQVFGALYVKESGGLKLKGDEAVLSHHEFLSFLDRERGGSHVHFVSPTPEVLDAALLGTALGSERVEEVTAVLAPMIGRLGLEHALRGELVDALTLDANYVRRCDAERSWRESA